MNTTVRAIDVGYSNTKFSTADNNGNITYHHFPSIAVAAGSAPMMSGGGVNTRDTMIVRVNGLDYEVGNEIERAHCGDDIKPPYDMYIHKNEYMALMLGALSVMNTRHIDLLVIGLPVMLCNTESQTISKKMKGEHRLAEGKLVTVNNVICVPQPMGGFADFVKSESVGQELVKSNELALIVDPGNGTLDWVVSQGKSVIDARCGSHEGGMKDSINGIVQQIERRVGIRVGYKSVDQAIINNQEVIIVRGKEISMSDFTGKQDIVANNSVDAMLRKIMSLDDIHKVIFVGGGGMHFMKAMAAQFPERVCDMHAIPDGLYANVRGFQLGGEDAMRGVRGVSA